MNYLGQTGSNIHVGDVSITGDLDVQGNQTVAQDLVVDGKFVIDGGIEIGGDLIVDGALNADVIKPKTASADIAVQNSAGATIATFTDSKSLKLDTIQEETADTFNIKNSAGTNVLSVVGTDAVRMYNIRGANMRPAFAVDLIVTDHAGTTEIAAFEETSKNFAVRQKLTVDTIEPLVSGSVSIFNVDVKDGVITADRSEADTVRPKTASTDINVENSAGAVIAKFTDSKLLVANHIETDTISEITANTFTLKNSAGFDVLSIEGSDVHAQNALKTNIVQEIDASSLEVKNSAGTNVLTITATDHVDVPKLDAGVIETDSITEATTSTFELKNSAGTKVLGITGTQVDVETNLRIGTSVPATQYSLPTVDGTAGQIITTAGDGTTTFESVNGVASVTQCDVLFTSTALSSWSYITKYTADVSNYFYDTPSSVWTGATYPNGASVYNQLTNWYTGEPTSISFDAGAGPVYPRAIGNNALNPNNTIGMFFLSRDVVIPDKAYDNMYIELQTGFQWGTSKNYGVRVYASGKPGEGTFVAGDAGGYPPSADSSTYWNDGATPQTAPYHPYTLYQESSNNVNSYMMLSKDIEIPPTIVEEYRGKTLRLSIQWSYYMDGASGTGFTLPEADRRAIVLSKFKVVGYFCSAVSPASVIPQASIDHALVTNLTADAHPQYPLLVGRSSGQTLIGGTAASENLTLCSTSHVTKGTITMLDDVEMSGKNITGVREISTPILGSGTLPMTITSDGALTLDAQGLLTHVLSGLDMNTTGIIGVSSLTMIDSITSNTIQISPASFTGAYSITLPSSLGTSGQVLQRSGGGGTTWATIAGDVTGVASSVLNNLCSFSDTSGKAIKDSGITATSGALTGVTTLVASGAITCTDIKRAGANDLGFYVNGVRRAYVTSTGAFTWDLIDDDQQTITLGTPGGLGTGVIFNQTSTNRARFCLNHNYAGGVQANQYFEIHFTDTLGNGVQIPNNSTCCIRPESDANRDLGESGRRFKDGHFSGQVNSATVDATGNITSGNIIKSDFGNNATVEFTDNFGANNLCGVFFNSASGGDYSSASIYNVPNATTTDRHIIIEFVGSDNGIRITNSTVPALTACADNKSDLGQTGVRWKDAYFSGEVKANSLDTAAVINSQGTMDLQVNDGTVMTVSTTTATASVDLDMNTNDVTGVGTCEVTDFKYAKPMYEAYIALGSTPPTTSITTANVVYSLGLGTTITATHNHASSITSAGVVTYTGTRRRVSHSGISVAYHLDGKGTVYMWAESSNTTRYPAPGLIGSITFPAGTIPASVISMEYDTNTVGKDISTAQHFFWDADENDTLTLKVTCGTARTLTVTYLNMFGMWMPAEVP